ncbi:MAG TPA: phosphoribosylglycinamide formyltransferase [bacterium]|nr:phosphoribosylglycinamide formyltransferase [bacterium]
MPERAGPLRVGVLVSGAGTVLQALIDACRRGDVPAEIVVVISNVPDSYALERARAAGIRAVTVDHRDFSSRAAFEAVLRKTLEEAGAGLVCLAGFLRILTPSFVDAFAGRIMNIHPALLPAFGGKGMYGDRVHEAVLASGARVSGCTVHFVTRDADAGPIIVQAPVAVEDGDTPATLSARVRREELRAYPLAVRLFAEDRLRIEQNRVRRLPSGEGSRTGGEIRAKP